MSEVLTDTGSLESLSVTETVETEGNYTTIRVNAEDDSNGSLQYAIDSDLPEAFGPSNEFTVEKGSEHTVYVKDAAGNISAQVYRVPNAAMDLEVNIGYSDTSSTAMVTDEEREAIEAGGGTVAETVITDNSNTAERLFYTVTTKNEHVFYLMVDQSRSDNNVYLLDQVTDEDLYALTGGDGQASAEKNNIFAAEAETQTEIQQTEDVSAKNKSSGGDWIWILLVLLCVAAFYYYKIYKPKQKKIADTADARDLDEFEPDEEEDEVLDFTVSEEEKAEMLEKIMNANDFEEEDLNYNPDMDAENDMELPEYQNVEEMDEAEGIEELELQEEEDE